MFKIPDWGDDIPDSEANFSKKTQAKIKKKKTTVEENATPYRPAISQKSKKILKKKKLPQSIVNGVKKNSNDSPKDFRTSPQKEKQQKHQKKKPKLDKKNLEKNEKPVGDSLSHQGIKSLDIVMGDELLPNVKKKKFDEIIEKDYDKVLLFSESPKTKKKMKVKMIITEKQTVKKSKKDKIKKMFETVSHRNSVVVSGNKLRDRMLKRLKAAQFRYLNEQLYTSSGSEAKQLFESDPAAFQVYHEGYQQQLKKWPVKPLDVIVSKIMKLPKTHTIADMGCGEATLSKRVPHSVRSFDLVATVPGVEACDMARTPLLTASIDVVVYCLALMGTDLTGYLTEANRVLKDGGLLLIAEVESRFEHVEAFTRDVQRLGFKLINLDKSHTVFFFMEFKKIAAVPKKKPTISLNPCLYKKR